MRKEPNENRFWHYVLPSMLTMVLSGFYAIVDGFFVGQATGDIGLGATISRGRLRRSCRRPASAWVWVALF